MQSKEQAEKDSKCCRCLKKVLPGEGACTAQDKYYHTKCFTCQKCQKILSGTPFYKVDDKVLCREDYLKTLDKCYVCSKPIEKRIITAEDKTYHHECFCCVECGKPIDGSSYMTDDANKIYCTEDYYKKHGHCCCVCKKLILPEPGEATAVRLTAMDRSYHVSCYRCEDCKMGLSSKEKGKECYPLDGHILCLGCNEKRLQAS